MDEDHSVIDLVEDTPSPVYHHKRHRISSNLLSRRNILNNGSSSSEMDMPSSEAPAFSNRSLSSANSPGSLSTHGLSFSNMPENEHLNNLPLPGASNFAEERAKAIRQKKQKDKTSPFKLPKHARSDFVKSSSLLASPSYQATKTNSAQIPTQNCSWHAAGTITQPNKRQSDGFSPAKSSGISPTKSAGISPTKFNINRNRVIGWPSSSDSSSDDEDLNRMIFRTKKVKHQHKPCTGQASSSGSTVNSLSNCNHTRHSATNQHCQVTNKMDGDEALYKHGKTALSSKCGSKRTNEVDQKRLKKFKKMKTSIDNSNESLFVNKHSSDKAFTSQAGSSSPKPRSVKHSPEFAVKSLVMGSSNTNKAALDRNSTTSTIASDLATSNNSKSSKIISKSTVQNTHNSPSLERHTQPGAFNTSPTITRPTPVSHSLSPTFDRLSSNHSSPTRINLFSHLSPIFSPPSILGYNPSENSGSMTRTPERARSTMSRFHPYKTNITSNHRQREVNKHQINETHPRNHSGSANRHSRAEMFNISQIQTEVINHRGRNNEARLTDKSPESPIIVDLTTTPDTSNAVKQIRQIEKDEEIARKLQEELDKEFALTLAQQEEEIPHQASHRRTEAPNFTLPEGVTGPWTPPQSPERQSRGGAMGIDGHHPVSLLDGWISPTLHRGQRGTRNRRARGTAQGIDENQMDQLMEELHAGMEVGDFVRLFMRTPRARGRRGRHRGHYYVTPDRSGNDYDELLRLGEMIGDATNKGLSQSDMNRLPTLTYKQTDNSKQEAECNICMCNYEDGDTQKILPCFHSYHSTCIDKWIAKNASCPVCRVEIKLG